VALVRAHWGLGLKVLTGIFVASPTAEEVEAFAFVLRALFDLPFDEIGPIVGRSPAAARQLASRARRRVRGLAPAPGLDP